MFEPAPPPDRGAAKASAPPDDPRREPIVAALRELLSGFEEADREAGGAILGDVSDRSQRDEVFTGLVTALLRMVFVLFAEARGLLPVGSEGCARPSALTELHARLAEERRRDGGALERRFDAWAQVIAIFRALHGGERAEGARTARGGDLFDPDKHPFLEGRSRERAGAAGEAPPLPRVSDGAVCRVLDRLSLLSGEPRSYAAIDVEQLGSAYERLMGFELAMATDNAERGAAAQVPARALSLQPGKERRRTGSYYTPRSLTQPIVETALRPIFERIGPEASSDEILNTKVCDPAMGSGAFVIEACRQLADRLVIAWEREGKLGALPAGEDAARRARLLVAPRCLYGVDKNPLAVSLARLSLWLVAGAREQPLTFVDHALRRGDSLVGLSKEQIATMSFAAPGALAALAALAEPLDVTRAAVYRAVARARSLRGEIHALGDAPALRGGSAAELSREADAAIGSVRLLGDAVVAAFFSNRSETARKKALEEARGLAGLWLSEGAGEAPLSGVLVGLGSGARRVLPFHWEVEFPEVFERENGGFDCFVGNPPFLGGRNTSAALGDRYVQWLLSCHEESDGGGDLVAHFFRRAFALTRGGGAIGLVATNTIAQGDTRATGLRYICKHGGTIYEARRHHAWPGAASVVVSLVFLVRGEGAPARRVLDGRQVATITASLFHSGGNEDPAPLLENEGKSYNGSVILGRGFTFDDSSPEATPTAEMRRILRDDPSSAERIFPYLGGEEINHDPRQAHRRHVIHFGGLSLEEAQRWPDLLRIVEEKVKPERQKRRNETARWPWWQFWRARREMYASISHLKRVLVCSLVSKHLAFAWCPTSYVFSHKLGVFALPSGASFAVLQSGVHERWARAFSSTLEDRLSYATSDCFETFPFPAEHAANGALEAIGEAYYEHRAEVMVRNKEGLTKTYNRFHDPGERAPQIQKMRELREAMDRAVLDAYGWGDIRLDYGFHRQIDESVQLGWGEETREEVLARLLELNRVMATRELLLWSGRRVGRGARRRL